MIEPGHRLVLPLQPIKTDRLIVRIFEPDDLEAAFELNSDPLVRCYTGGVLERDESDKRMQTLISDVAATGLGARAVVERSTNQMVGYCGLQEFHGRADIELFYGLHPGAWGKGYATEAAKAVVKWGFGNGMFDRFLAIVHPQNENSIRVLGKLGFGRIGSYMHPRWAIEHALLELRNPNQTD
jgi:RimJ/RimL family protein N-acetyltransferase